MAGNTTRQAGKNCAGKLFSRPSGKLAWPVWHPFGLLSIPLFFQLLPPHLTPFTKGNHKRNSGCTFLSCEVLTSQNIKRLFTPLMETKFSNTTDPCIWDCMSEVQFSGQEKKKKNKWKRKKTSLPPHWLQRWPREASLPKLSWWCQQPEHCEFPRLLMGKDPLSVALLLSQRGRKCTIFEKRIPNACSKPSLREQRLCHHPSQPCRCLQAGSELQYT